jgi:hypothetical protein
MKKDANERTTEIIIKKPKGPQAIAATRRPANFYQLSGEEQWEIDKQLGILDWDGDPNT